jgi:HD-GYP domain-containing protein (c-di-GMP phosphodiesterase class II)
MAEIRNASKVAVDAAGAVASLARIASSGNWQLKAPLEARIELRHILGMSTEAMEDGKFAEAVSLAKKVLDSIAETATMFGIGGYVLEEMLGRRPASLDSVDFGDFGPILPVLDVLEARVPGSLGHSLRVGSLATTVVLYLGEDGCALPAFLAGLVHDVGKAFVKDGLLLKPSVLEPAERAEIERHSIAGADLVALSPAIRNLSEIVRAHHEWFCGSGYPDHLAGEQIPFLARVLTICDSYDAMTSPRPYRASLSRSEALIEIAKGLHRQFDPDLGLAFMTMHLGVPSDSRSLAGPIAAVGDHKCPPIERSQRNGKGDVL